MVMSSELLKIDCAKTVLENKGFIRSKVESLNRKGVVLGLSGGLFAESLNSCFSRSQFSNPIS